MDNVRIWKFRLDPNFERNVIGMPRGARLLSAQNQDGALCVWAEVDIGEEFVDRTVIVCGTGDCLPREIGRHVGTAICGAGVWHVYDGESCEIPGE